MAGLRPAAPLPSVLLPVFFTTHSTPPELDSLSLHDALPISARGARTAGPAARFSSAAPPRACRGPSARGGAADEKDRKSTRLNSSHPSISYAVFCLKKKKHYNLECQIEYPHHPYLQSFYRCP